MKLDAFDSVGHKKKKRCEILNMNIVNQPEPLLETTFPQERESREKTSARKRGFTLVELLVVVAIIGVLIGLLMPAISAAREAANRMNCANNIRQLSLAVMSYNDLYRKLPPLSGPGAYSIFVSLLPYMEQTNLAKEIREFGIVEQGISTYMNKSFFKRPPWYDYQIPTLLCPSGYYAETIHPTYNTGATSYLVSAGDFPVTAKGPILTDINPPLEGQGRGPFRRLKWTSLSAVKDGTSNTVAFGERIIGRITAGGGGKSLRMVDTYVAMAWKNGTNMGSDPTEEGGDPLYPSKCLEFIGIGGDYIQPMPTGSGLAVNSLQGREWVSGGALPTIFNTIMPPNGPSCSARQSYVAGPTSNHSGGCNIAFLDGSCRFINDIIDTGNLSIAPVQRGHSPYGAWGAMGSAAGSETIEAL